MKNNSDFDRIKNNYQKIISNLGPAKLLAVTKYTSDENIDHLYQLGHRDFGENRVDELSIRSAKFPKDIRWHFIGNLQSNKLKKLCEIEGLHSIHSVDRQSILEKLIKINPNSEIYLQFNAGGESEKNGFKSYDDLKLAIKCFVNAGASHLKFAGLMTMAAIRTDDYDSDAKKSFELLSQIKEQARNDFPNLDFKLNMGMSRDYQLAIQCGSELVRVGSALYE